MFTTAERRGARIDCCDHEHLTRDEAQTCLVKHQNECRKDGKLSKRQVIEVDSLDELYEEEELF